MGSAHLSTRAGLAGAAAKAEVGLKHGTEETLGREEPEREESRMGLWEPSVCLFF